MLHDSMWRLSSFVAECHGSATASSLPLPFSRLPGTTVTVAAGTMVSVPVWSLHHDPRYWTDPETFHPDRFLPENKDKILSGTYLPFGLGPRNCIGESCRYRLC